MEKTILNLNVDSVVLLLNGSVGVILTSVNHAIRNNVKDNMLASIPKTNYQNVKVQENVQLEVIIKGMVIKNH